MATNAAAVPSPQPQPASTSSNDYSTLPTPSSAAPPNPPPIPPKINPNPPPPPTTPLSSRPFNPRTQSTPGLPSRKSTPPPKLPPRANSSSGIEGIDGKEGGGCRYTRDPERLVAFLIPLPKPIAHAGDGEEVFPQVSFFLCWEGWVMGWEITGLG